MKAFVIHPIKDADPDFMDEVKSFVKGLEAAGHFVYLPVEDTKQEDKTLGYRICLNNKHAIIEADVVFVAWDGQSRGCVFDLGMAFAMDKEIRIIPGLWPKGEEGKKCFENMIPLWEKFQTKTNFHK